MPVRALGFKKPLVATLFHFHNGTYRHPIQAADAFERV
jgi:hypothetical protein